MNEDVELPEEPVEPEAPVPEDEPEPAFEPAAEEGGGIEIDIDDDPPPPNEPVETAPGIVGRQPRIRDIDFSRPTKFGQEHQRRIVRLHESFCRAIGTQLSAELRLPLDFQLISTAQMSWASATSELPGSSLFGVMNVRPAEERAL